MSFIDTRSEEINNLTPRKQNIILRLYVGYVEECIQGKKSPKKILDWYSKEYQELKYKRANLP